MIRATGFIVYQSLEDWAMTQFVYNGHKERSTVRAKCRSVFNWYEAKDFDISTKNTHKPLKEYLKETKMTRQEHMKRISAEKAERNKRAVINIMTGLYADDYKKKNGAWHFGKIAEATGLSSKTVAKIIKEVTSQTKLK
jgi:AraC-like DNA-binding protein